MRNRSIIGLLLAAVLLVGSLLWWRLVRPGDSAGVIGPSPSPPTTFPTRSVPPKDRDPVGPPPREVASDPRNPKVNFPEPSLPHADLTREIDRLLTRLTRESPPEDIRAHLLSLKSLIHELPPDSAASAIIAFLQSGRDAATGLSFVVGGEGVLDEAPTLRVALLDWLAQTDPSQALGYSRALLPVASHPDEYAIALRNLAWLNPNGEFNAEIADAFARMLDRGDWLAKPTAGFLEAFDAAVAVGGRDLWMQLGSVLRMESDAGPALEHPANRAAFIALDRLMLREPETLVALLDEQPDWLDWAPQHRASLLTRLDVRSEVQRAFLRDYLLGGSHRPGELEYFSSIFPNVNRFSGNRLVTEWEEMQSTADLDQAALDQVRQWAADPAFADVSPHLQTIRQRLEAFYTR